MTNMTIDIPVLYKAQPHHGVVALLTKEAYEAFRVSWELYLRYGSWEAAIEDWPQVMQQLNARVAAGTFTFVDSDRYYESHPMYRLVHSGSNHLLDEIQRLCTVVPFSSDMTFGVPFSSGDLDSYQELLDQGFGPHFKELAEVIIQAQRAIEQQANELTTHYLLNR